MGVFTGKLDARFLPVIVRADVVGVFRPSGVLQRGQVGGERIGRPGSIDVGMSETLEDGVEKARRESDHTVGRCPGAQGSGGDAYVIERRFGLF